MATAFMRAAYDSTISMSSPDEFWVDSFTADLFFHRIAIFVVYVVVVFEKQECHFIKKNRFKKKYSVILYFSRRYTTHPQTTDTQKPFHKRRFTKAIVTQNHRHTKTTVTQKPPVYIYSHHPASILIHHTTP